MFKDTIKEPWTWIVLLSITLITIGSGSILSHAAATVVFAGFSQTFAASVFSSIFFVMVFLCLMVGLVLYFVGYPIGVMHVNLISPLLITYVFGEKDIGS